MNIGEDKVKSCISTTLDFCLLVGVRISYTSIFTLLLPYFCGLGKQ